MEPFEAEEDQGLTEVEAELYDLDPAGLRWAKVIRKTYDEAYRGEISGRYRWEDLMKTEKTHFGSMFEINAQREFEFDSGDATDFRIAGHEVDAKWSQREGGWMLPPEVFDKIALVVTGSDVDAEWSLGLVRVTARHRRVKVNRDLKSQLSAEGRAAIRWLWRNEPMRPNVLLQLDPGSVDLIFSPAPGMRDSGTRRLDALFREAEGRIVHRSSVATVAKQLDHQKRLRRNGGARDTLQRDGYLLLSGKYHSGIAKPLGVPVPLADEYISVRVVPADEGQGVLIAGKWWRRAGPGDVVGQPAPSLDDT